MSSVLAQFAQPFNFSWLQQVVVVNGAVTRLLAACLLGGCSLKGAPSYSIFGAFFTAWLLCAGIGIAGSIGLRSLFIATGLEAEMPFRPLMYFAFAAGLTLSIWLLLFWAH